MRVGIVTDIHNDVTALRQVLDKLEALQIDQLLTLGDTCDALAPPHGSDEVADTLRDRNAIGVWGNHDCFFHHNTPDHLYEQFGDSTFEFIRQMEPHLKIGNFGFSHMESSVDANDFEQLWEIDDTGPNLLERAGRAFLGSDAEVQFVGHYHHWWAATTEGQLDWDGGSPLEFVPTKRYFVVIAAAFLGYGAVLDTSSCCLTPVCASSHD